MKIDEIHIRGFGTLIDRKFPFPMAGVTILTGKNESGKTTFLEFVRRMLFGFPTGRNASKEYDPISGQIKGGSISVMFEDGKGYAIHRIKVANKKFQQYLLMEDRTTTSAEELNVHMGKIRKEFYNRVFALSHKDLWDGGTLVNDNSVKDFLLGGLLSIKNANPHKFIESCTKDANNLFLQKGSVREINALNNELKKINREIHEIEEKTRGYQDKSNELAELQQEKKRLEEEEQAVQKELTHYRILTEAWDPWLSITQKKEENNGINIPGNIPDDFFVKHDRRIEELQIIKIEKEKEINDLANNLESLKLKTHQLSINDEIIAHESDIMQIDRLHQQYISDNGRLSTIISKLSGKNRDLDIALEGLGPSWNTEKLETVNLSSELKNALFTAKVTVEKSEHEYLQELNKKQSLEDEISRMELDIPEPDLEKLSAADSIAGIEKLVSEIQYLEQEEAHWSRQQGEAQEKYNRSLSSLTNEGIEISPSFLSAFQYDTALSSVRTFEGEIHAHENKAMKAGLMVSQEEQNLSRCISEQAEVEDAIKSIGKTNSTEKLNKQLKALYKLKELLMHRENRKKAESSRGIGIHLIISVLLFITGLICTGAGLLLDLLIITGLGMGILVISGLLYMAERNNRYKMAEEEEREDREIEDYLKKLNITVRQPEDVDRLIRHIEQLSDKAGKAEALRINLSQVMKRKESAEDDIHKASIQMDIAKKDYDACLHRWYIFLSETFSPVLSERKLTPGDVYPILSGIKAASQELDDINRIKQEVAGRQVNRKELMNRTKEMLSPLTRVFSIDVLPDDSTGLTQCINEITEQIRTERTKQESLNTLHDTIKRRKLSLEEADRSINMILDRLNQERGKFREILVRAGLPDDSNPGRLESLIQEILAARAHYSSLTETEQELKELEKQIQLYENKVLSLRRLVSESTDDSSVNFLTERLVSLLSNEKDIIRQRDNILDSIRDIENKILKKRESLNITLAEEKSLLSDAGIPDYQAYCEYRERFTKGIELKREINQKHELINTIYGRPDAFDLISDELSSLSKEDVMANIENLSFRIQEIREKISAVDNKIGSIDTEMTILRDSEEHNRLLLERNFLHTTINDLGKKWAVSTLAAELLRQSLEKFEREKQPAVVSRATEYFRIMTNGAYTNIILPISGEEFEVIMDNSYKKSPGILSQGTAEQLYISLRLAYATEYCMHNEPLPLILDDILINCDEVRHAQAIQAIAAVAEHTQVIYCTCHNETVEQFSNIINDVHIIDLDSDNTLYQRSKDPDEITIQGEGFSVL